MYPGLQILRGRTVNYGYDHLYRLTSETIAADPSGINGAVNYTYDPVGNRTQMTSTLAPISAGLFNYDANDRFTAGDTYDANGNTTSSGGIANGYDFENRLIQKGGVTLVYDGDGNRVSKTVAGITTTYLVDTQNPTGYAQVLQEQFNGAGPRELQHTYVYGLERISENRSFFTGQQTLSQTFYFDYDGHGSVRALTDSTGAVTDTYDYDAFGNLTHSTTTLSSPTPNEFLFAGEQYDSNLSLYYNRARYLNTSTGRFWTMDDDEGNGREPSSLHKYLYAAANPVGNIDPTGNEFEDITFAAGEEATIGAEEDAAALRIEQTAFRTTLYAGEEVVSSQPTILLRAIAALTATAVTAASVFEAFSSPGELPDVAASQQNQDDLFPIVLFRDVDSTTGRNFRWRGPVKDPDGLSFFETPFKSPEPKKFSVGFRAKYRGPKRDGAPGGFVEQELLNIPIIYSPSIGGEGHWSAPVTQETALQYEEKFAEAAQRIKNEDPNRFPRNPNY